MPEDLTDPILHNLLNGNHKFILGNSDELKKHIQGQSPKVAVLTCADSRVIPEIIFNKSIGDIFVVRVAGNVAIDPSVITSLEYAVDHLHVSHLIILGHTHCGAVKATEDSTDSSVDLFNEIKKGFEKNTDHIIGNVMYQLEMLPERSKIISDALKNERLKLIGAIYNLENGKVEVL